MDSDDTDKIILNGGSSMIPEQFLPEQLSKIGLLHNSPMTRLMHEILLIKESPATVVLWASIFIIDNDCHPSKN